MYKVMHTLITNILPQVAIEYLKTSKSSLVKLFLFLTPAFLPLKVAANIAKSLLLITISGRYGMRK